MTTGHHSCMRCMRVFVETTVIFFFVVSASSSSSTQAFLLVPKSMAIRSSSLLSLSSPMTTTMTHNSNSCLKMSWRSADNYKTTQLNPEEHSEQMKQFANRQAGLTKDTAILSILFGFGLWVVCDDNPFVAVSYFVGAGLGLAFLYGLGKYYLGGPIESTETIRGANIGQARIVVLLFLYTLVGRFQTDGLIYIPSFMGFFTYQLAALYRGVRANMDNMDDEEGTNKDANNFKEDPSMAMMRDLL